MAEKCHAYLLYSVGRNAEDDGGRDRNHPEAADDPDYEGDDIAVRTPGKG